MGNFLLSQFQSFPPMTRYFRSESKSTSRAKIQFVKINEYGYAEKTAFSTSGAQQVAQQILNECQPSTR